YRHPPLGVERVERETGAPDPAVDSTGGRRARTPLGAAALLARGSDGQAPAHPRSSRWDRAGDQRARQKPPERDDLQPAPAFPRSGDSVAQSLAAGRRAYLFLIHGELKLNGLTLSAGDQARITGERSLQLAAGSAPADFLLLDLP